MTLPNINTMKKDRGFTLVELLIVIVVIAILAAISLVAYNGIQDRSKTTANAALASTVAKKAEAGNTIYNTYPADVAAFASKSETKLDDPSKVIAGPASATNKTLIGYKVCGGTTGGAQVSYWDYTSNSVKFNGLGGASSTTGC